jgi:hypothetical protein
VADAGDRFVVEDLGAVWERVKSSGEIGAMGIRESGRATSTSGSPGVGVAHPERVSELVRGDDLDLLGILDVVPGAYDRDRGAVDEEGPGGAVESVLARVRPVILSTAPEEPTARCLTDP